MSPVRKIGMLVCRLEPGIVALIRIIKNVLTKTTMLARDGGSPSRGFRRGRIKAVCYKVLLLLFPDF